MKVLFEVTFKVDARRLGEALVALDGKVYDVNHKIIKMDTGEPEMKLLPHHPSGKPTKRVNRIKEYINALKTSGVDTFTTKEVIATVGVEKNYTSTVLSKLQKDKVIKRVKVGTYKISG